MVVVVEAEQRRCLVTGGERDWCLLAGFCEPNILSDDGCSVSGCAETVDVPEIHTYKYV